MRSYGQYCPIARASEILAQRWTPVIIRDLLGGPTSFSRLAEGIPGLSRSLLTTRLRQLESLGLAVKDDEGLYSLSPGGQDLAAVVSAMGSWGERWLDVTPQHADPGYLLNAWVKTYLAVDDLPSDRVVVRFDFVDQPKLSRMWVIFDGEDSEVCRKHPGYDEDLVVNAESVALAEWHLGRIEWSDALDSGRIRVDGIPKLARRLPTWNRRSQWVSADHAVPAAQQSTPTMSR